MPLIDYSGKFPEFTDPAKLVPEFAKIAALKKTDLPLYRSCMIYLYFVYDKSSPYEKMLLHDKHKVLNKDFLTELIKCEELEKNKILEPACKKYLMLEFTPKERMLRAWVIKVDKYVQLWSKLDVDDEDAAIKNAKLLQQIKPLLDFKEYIDKQRDDVSEGELYGGGQAGLFELDDL
jgi:hypothetical protein